MPERIFRTEPAFFGVRCFTRFRVFHRSSYKTGNHPHVSISYRTNSGSRISNAHGHVASISARSSDILRENYPHLCGNLSHLRISSSYILPCINKNCNTFFHFFHLFLCRKKRISTAPNCANYPTAKQRSHFYPIFAPKRHRREAISLVSLRYRYIFSYVFCAKCFHIQDISQKKS